MATRNSVQEELDSLGSINIVVDTYEEIAAGRIRKTRDSVLKTRNFLDQIREVFEQVKVSYHKEIEQLIKARGVKNDSKFQFLTQNGKTLYVLLSSNTGLYGDIVRRTFDLFIKDVFEGDPNNATQTKGDIVIIGRYGRSLFEEMRLKVPYTYFDFPDNSVDLELLKPIVKLMLGYETVIVFFGEFQNVIKQAPIAYDVSATPIDLLEANKNQPPTKYIFEPSLEKIFEFFEKEIFASIVEQTVRESQLGKFASRMVSLDSALDNIKKRIKSTQFLRDRTRHREQNRKQIETFASMSLWNR